METLRPSQTNAEPPDLIPRPELQVGQDPSDDLPLNDKAEDLHLHLETWTDQGIHLFSFGLNRSQSPF